MKDKLKTRIETKKYILCPKCGVLYALSPAYVDPKSIKCSCGVDFARDVEIED